MDKQIVEGKSNMFRDKISKAIISTDEAARIKYLARKRELASKANQITALERRVLDLEAKMEVILSSLEVSSHF